MSGKQSYGIFLQNRETKQWELATSDKAVSRRQFIKANKIGLDKIREDRKQFKVRLT